MYRCLLPFPFFPSFPPAFDAAPRGSIKRSQNILAPVKYVYSKARKEIGRFRVLQTHPSFQLDPGSGAATQLHTTAPGTTAEHHWEGKDHGSSTGGARGGRGTAASI